MFREEGAPPSVPFLMEGYCVMLDREHLGLKLGIFSSSPLLKGCSRCFKPNEFIGSCSLEVGDPREA